MRLRVLDSILEVAPGAWNALVTPEMSPFLHHGYLAALEISKSIGAGDGLVPKHLTLWQGDQLVAAAPAYLSRSETYDQMVDWAHAIATKNELPYYPVVTIRVPYATAPSTRFLTAGGVDRDDAIARLIAGARELATTSETPVVHVWSCSEDETATLERLGFHARVMPYYAWTNDAYTSFDQFLQRLDSKRRNAIVTERRRVREANISVRKVLGTELTNDIVELLWQCDQRTTKKYEGTPVGVFNHDFYKLLGELLGERVEVYVAERDGVPVASSFGCASAVALYPKQWGAIEEIPFLHFEVTWYRAMEEAIARGLRLVDGAGITLAKLLRGFQPAGYTPGATWIGDEDLHAAFRTFVDNKERVAVDAKIAEMRTSSPYKLVR